MKKLLAIMCIFVLSLSLMACADNVNGNTMGKTETKKENKMAKVKWDDWEICVNDYVIKLGKTKVLEVEKAGFGEFVKPSGLSWEDADTENNALVGNFESLMYKVSYIGITVQNKEKNETLVDDYTVCIFNLDRDGAEEIKDVEIILPGGFDFETSKIDDLIDAYGEPESVLDWGETTRYDWFVTDTGSLGIWADNNGNLTQIAYAYYL